MSLADLRLEEAHSRESALGSKRPQSCEGKATGELVCPGRCAAPNMAIGSN